MDTNGLRFWSKSRREDWFGAPDSVQNLQWCEGNRTVRLSAQSAAPVFSAPSMVHQALRAAPAPVMDRFGNLVLWDHGLKLIPGPARFNGDRAISVDGSTPSDLAFGDDDILYVARDGHIELIDTRQRFRPQHVELAEFTPVKLVPRRNGGVIALDIAKGQIAVLTGHPMREGLFPPSPLDQFSPALENPDPPKLVLLPLEPIANAVCVSCSWGGRVAVLSADDTVDAKIIVVDDGAISFQFMLTGLKHPVSMAWNGETEIAVLAADGATLAANCFVYEAEQTGDALPNGRDYPLVNATLQRFVNVVSVKPVYAGGDGKARALVPASALKLARQGAVEFFIDSHDANTVWHRLYLEACIPVGCLIDAELAATDRLEDVPQYSSHVFGGPPVRGVAQAAWLDDVSELPHHEGLLQGQHKRGETGLFSVLIQRHTGNVRRIAGRLLRVRLTLKGDSHATPSLAGFRAYGSRFSYRDHYLPQFYQDDFIPPQNTERASGPDYLERFLCGLEETFTLIEGQIAEAHLLTRASSTPASALPWLGQWIGIDMADGEGSAKDREILKAAPYTARLHGTLGGLRAALELETGGRFIEGPRFADNAQTPRIGELAMAMASGGAIRGLVLGVNGNRRCGVPAILTGGKISAGAIVVLEGFRLRRTFATILGANLADEDDALTGGLFFSGNSFVGDSLILGDEFRQDVLSLYADVPDAREQQSVLDFFDKLAFRTTVLVHDVATPQDLVRLQRIADAESPAHVEVTVTKARYPFLVGAGALLGVDTFLSQGAVRGAFEIGRSQLGAADVITNPGLLTKPSQGQQP